MNPGNARQNGDVGRLDATGSIIGPIATFIGGCVAASPDEEDLAYRAGQQLGLLGFRLHHGGYNGLMEQAAKGASSVGARVVAVTLRDKPEWGGFNPYVTETIYSPDMGTRLRHLIERADVIVAMGGGVGSLHEVTAALWYAGNVRRVPVVVLGRTVGRLQDFLLHDRWLYESPTRPLDFLHGARTQSELSALLPDLAAAIHAARAGSRESLSDRVRQMACVDGRYQLANGEVLPGYFDSFRIAADVTLSADLAQAMARLVHGQVDVVAGVAVGGVVLAANLAVQLGLPLLVVRPSPKRYGSFAHLEGVVTSGQRALLVDDVVRSGHEMVNAARVLSGAGLIVRDCICVLERAGIGRARLRHSGIALSSVMTQGDLPGREARHGYGGTGP